MLVYNLVHVAPCRLGKATILAQLQANHIIALEFRLAEDPLVSDLAPNVPQGILKPDWILR